MLGYSVPSQPEPETFEGECLWLEPEDFLCRQPEIETLSIMIASRYSVCSTSMSNSRKIARRPSLVNFRKGWLILYKHHQTLLKSISLVIFTRLVNIAQSLLSYKALSCLVTI